jgi:hypothetical protein
VYTNIISSVGESLELIHTKRRNRLKVSTVNKLAYVKANSQLPAEYCAKQDRLISFDFIAEVLGELNFNVDDFLDIKEDD